MFREVIGIPSFYVMLYRARQGHVQPRRHCKHKRDKNPDNPAWSLGSCSLTREVLSSIAEYRSPDLSPSMRRPIPVKSFLSFPQVFFCSIDFPLSQAASVATLPSALFVERLSLGASWVSWIQ